MTPDRRVGECEVCALVYGDHAPKDTGYCHFCDTWMCERCRTDPIARVAAASIRKFRKWRRG
jgi:hypothetical protein